MTFRLKNPEDVGARCLDGDPQIADQFKKSVPAGWKWFAGLVFNLRDDAVSCMNMYGEHIANCDQGACSSRSAAPEMKVIKRGGSTDPHYLVVVAQPSSQV